MYVYHKIKIKEKFLNVKKKTTYPLKSERN